MENVKVPNNEVCLRFSHRFYGNNNYMKINNILVNYHSSMVPDSFWEGENELNRILRNDRYKNLWNDIALLPQMKMCRTTHFEYPTHKCICRKDEPIELTNICITEKAEFTASLLMVRLFCASMDNYQSDDRTAQMHQDLPNLEEPAGKKVFYLEYENVEAISTIAINFIEKCRSLVDHHTQDNSTYQMKLELWDFCFDSLQLCTKFNAGNLESEEMGCEIPEEGIKKLKSKLVYAKRMEIFKEGVKALGGVMVLSCAVLAIPGVSIPAGLAALFMKGATVAAIKGATVGTTVSIKAIAAKISLDVSLATKGISSIAEFEIKRTATKHEDKLKFEDIKNAKVTIDPSKIVGTLEGGSKIVHPAGHFWDVYFTGKKLWGYYKTVTSTLKSTEKLADTIIDLEGKDKEIYDNSILNNEFQKMLVKRTFEVFRSQIDIINNDKVSLEFIAINPKLAKEIGYLKNGHQVNSDEEIEKEFELSKKMERERVESNLRQLVKDTLEERAKNYKKEDLQKINEMEAYGKTQDEMIARNFKEDEEKAKKKHENDIKNKSTQEIKQLEELLMKKLEKIENDKNETLQRIDRRRDMEKENLKHEIDNLNVQRKSDDELYAKSMERTINYALQYLEEDRAFDSTIKKLLGKSNETR